MVMIELNTSAPVDSLGLALAVDALGEARWSKGGADAKIIITEFSDFQCPACGVYHPIVKKVAEELGDQVRFSYRHFPLKELHKNAVLAAKASEAAGAQGKFWEMHDMLFDNQAIWSDSSGPASIFSNYAVAIGLDPVKFKLDLNSQDIANKVSGDYALGTALQVYSTPTFFINNIKLNRNPRSYEEFKSIIDKLLSENL